MKDLGFVDVSAAVVGSVYKIDWSLIQQEPTLRQQDRNLYDSVAIYNESGCGFLVTMKQTNRSFTLPAGGWIPALPCTVPGGIDKSLTLTVQYVLTNAQVSQVHSDYFLPGEATSGNSVSVTLGNSPIGGAVAVSNTPTIAQEPTTLITGGSTSPLTVVFGVPATGLYEVTAGFVVNNSGTATITLQVSYTDGFLGGSVTNRSLSTSGGVTLNGAVLANNGVGVNGANFYMQAGTCSITFQDSTGTPNDSCSVGLIKMF